MSTAARAFLVFVALSAAFLYFLGPILAPFVLSAGFAYLGDPLADRLERLGLSRMLSVVIVFGTLLLLVLGGLVLLMPPLVRQVASFVGHLPDYLRWFQEVGLPRLGVTWPAELNIDADKLKQLATENLPEAGGMAAVVARKLTHSGAVLLGFIALLLLVPVVTFYLLLDWDRMVAWVDAVLPLRQRETIRGLARETDEVLSGFLRGQLLVMLALAVIDSLGLWLVGLDIALLMGFVIGLVSFVPYLGFITGLIAATSAMLIQSHQLLPAALVVIVLCVGQALEAAVLTPRLVGHRIGLHPVSVIFAVMAGGHLFGFIGVLLALPFAAIVAVLLRHAKGRWLESDAYRTP